jgi:glycosyltransferase involved in cell wall biosynthesis
MKKLSVTLATLNEEHNLARCLESVKEIADEIVVVDGSSKDKTVEIAKSFGAYVVVKDNPAIFHLNKQIALDLSTAEWSLQMDADEVVSPALSKEIRDVINLTNDQLENRRLAFSDFKLFVRHQNLIEQRDGITGKEDGPIYAFYISRKNYFLGKYLRYGGVYPDGVIRLIKKGKARWPCKSVHEQMEIDGKVSWLQHSLLHYDSPTFKRYLERNSRYIDLLANGLKSEKIKKSPFQFVNYCIVKPIHWFLLTQIRHKGILDGYQGIIFSFFSALRFPRAYWRYLKNEKTN